MLEWPSICWFISQMAAADTGTTQNLFQVSHVTKGTQTPRLSFSAFSRPSEGSCIRGGGPTIAIRPGKQMSGINVRRELTLFEDNRIAHIEKSKVSKLELL